MRAKSEPPEWYFFKAGSHAGMKAGPLSWEQLRSQVHEGTLEPADVVWDPGSGWRTATQIPDLFPAVALQGAAGAPPSTSFPAPAATSHGRPWLRWVIPLVVVVIVGGGLGTYFGFFHDNGMATASGQTTTTGDATTTTMPVTTTQSTASGFTTTTSAATTVTETTAAGERPDLYLDESDMGREVRLHVGDRVRIELKPKVNSRVSSVAWDFQRMVVKETDSGSEKAGDRVLKCWLELEATLAGPVTVRAHYEYEFGFVNTPWVVYLVVTR